MKNATLEDVIFAGLKDLLEFGDRQLTVLRILDCKRFAKALTKRIDEHFFYIPNPRVSVGMEGTRLLREHPEIPGKKLTCMVCLLIGGGVYRCPNEAEVFLKFSKPTFNVHCCKDCRDRIRAMIQK